MLNIYDNIRYNYISKFKLPQNYIQVSISILLTIPSELPIQIEFEIQMINYTNGE